MKQPNKPINKRKLDIFHKQLLITEQNNKTLYSVTSVNNVKYTIQNHTSRVSITNNISLYQNYGHRSLIKREVN